MISELTLKFTEVPSITFPTTGITVFVGPNNSGKSLVLREIEEYCARNSGQPFQMVVNLKASWLEEAELEALLKKFEKFRKDEAREGTAFLARFDPSEGSVQRGAVNLEQLFSENKNRTSQDWWITHFVKWGLLRLDGRSRFNLTNDRPGGDLEQPPKNMLASLFGDDAARAEISAFVEDAFGVYFIIDPTNLGQLRIKLSSEEGSEFDQSLKKPAREFYKRAMHVKDASDGVQAFVGIVVAVISGEYHTILIDEPEAFLHPPLARKLGKNLGDMAKNRKGTLFASTHSADFLMGCLQSSRDVRVVRLEYSNGKSRGKLVDSDKLEKFFSSPLVRSANVISSLFHDGVIVTEADNDRVFYSEVCHRIVGADLVRALIQVVNAQNKQTIRDIIGPLRQFGVPAAGVFDIDLLEDGGAEWTSLLRSANVPAPLHESLAIERASILKLFNGHDRKEMKRHGILLLDAGAQQAAKHLFGTLAEYGIFVVDRGELESWLPELGVVGKGTDWAVSMLSRLGSDSKSREYVQPAAGDVWDFVRDILAWIQHPDRKGME